MSVIVLTFFNDPGEWCFRWICWKGSGVNDVEVKGSFGFRFSRY